MKSLGDNRREFLKTAAAAAAASLLPPRRTAAAETADTLVRGKDPRLIVHAAGPAVFETPLDLLAHSPQTPTPLLFVRNNQQPSDVATIRPVEAMGWKIELAGLIDRPQSIDAAALFLMLQVEQEMVLQCSGNGRSLFAPAAPTKGTPWVRGGVGNVRFSGVTLAAVLERARVKVKPEAKYLTAEGRDAPAAGQQDFEHSLPIDEALARSMLALRLAGDKLPAIHGGPVRLVTPGYYGTMHVKWLTRLRFEAHESSHTSQIPNYRTPKYPITPGEDFQATYENSEPNWRMKTKCLVFSPAADAKLASGKVAVSGVAFNDGAARIERVLLSSDAGDTWQSAELEAPHSPYAWTRWQTHLKLKSGKQQIWARAIDALGRGQPADGAIDWNPHGYAWNGMEKIDVTVG